MFLLIVTGSFSDVLTCTPPSSFTYAKSPYNFGDNYDPCLHYHLSNYYNIILRKIVLLPYVIIANREHETF